MKQAARLDEMLDKGRPPKPNPNIHFQQNPVATHNLLEHLKRIKNTSTVYGEATKIPTPEDYSPLKQK